MGTEKKDTNGNSSQDWEKVYKNFSDIGVGAAVAALAGAKGVAAQLKPLETVVTGAALKCPYGTAPSKFTGKKRGFTLDNKDIGTIEDATIYNTGLFGGCTAPANQSKVCKPFYSQLWMFGNNRNQVKNVDSLSTYSKLRCVYGGILYFIDSGQCDNGTYTVNGYKLTAEQIKAFNVWVDEHGGQYVKFDKTLYLDENAIAALNKSFENCNFQSQDEFLLYASNLACEGLSNFNSGFLRERGKGEGYDYGTTYYGRGSIQVTWDYNYKKFSEYMNNPEIYSNPDIVATDYNIGMEAGTWYYHAEKRALDYNTKTATPQQDLQDALNAGKSPEEGAAILLKDINYGGSVKEETKAGDNYNKKLNDRTNAYYILRYITSGDEELNAEKYVK